MLKHPLVEYYRCPDAADCFELLGNPCQTPGYFRFGEDAVAYGRPGLGPASKNPESRLADLLPYVQMGDSKCLLPIDPSEVLDNLRRERYVTTQRNGNGVYHLGKKAYYAMRPVLPFAFRSYLKRMANRGWEQKPFPSWPVDLSVDKTLETLLLLSLKTQGVQKIPFIWFWPNGYSGCVVMTHDVETCAGLDFCSSLMDLDDRYEIKASFQFVPEERYAVPAQLLQEIRERGFEINVHDWNHDGLLFSDRNLFLTRAEKINEFAWRWGAKGFRSGALYRNQEWYEAFTFDYDMSVPNVGHLDPQTGGCCTVMPYFVGRILEIPLTTIQDYMLFHLLGDYSIDLWKRQLEIILERNGMASFIVHPDYILERRARAVHTELLEHLSFLRSQRNLWIVPPGEVNSWCRRRSQLKVLKRNGRWEIDGPGKEQACLAYATLGGENLVYEFEQKPDPRCVET
jgi:hypothetical protein